jgi:hypothetical protein
MSILAPQLLCGFALLLLGCHRSEPGAASNAVAKEEANTAAEEVLDSTSINGRVVQIVGTNDGCMLKSGSEVIPLRPKGPCFFLRRNGKVQTQAYKDANVDWVLIVAGTPMSAVNRKTWNLGEKDICGEQSQGIVSKGGSLRATASLHSGGAYCKDKGVDEKEFWAFVHDPGE